MVEDRHSIPSSQGHLLSNNPLPASIFLSSLPPSTFFYLPFSLSIPQIMKKEILSRQVFDTGLETCLGTCIPHCSSWVQVPALFLILLSVSMRCWRQEGFGEGNQQTQDFSLSCWSFKQIFIFKSGFLNLFWKSVRDTERERDQSSHWFIPQMAQAMAKARTFICAAHVDGRGSNTQTIFCFPRYNCKELD